MRPRAVRHLSAKTCIDTPLNDGDRTQFRSISTVPGPGLSQKKGSGTKIGASSHITSDVWEDGAATYVAA
jgi:hypothetical protein